MSQVEASIGLVTVDPSDRVALRGVRFSCRVAGISARTTVEQTFVNLENRAIEAVYTFPLPDGAAVCGFEVVFFDKVFTGVIEETDKAIERYDDAISEGHGAYMAEQHRPDVFTVRVGNLKPRQAVTIRLSYLMDLDIVDRSIRLAFPTTLAPRYRGSAGMDPVDAMIDGETLNPPHVLSVPYGLTMDVVVDLGKNLEAVESSSHAIRLEKMPQNQWKVDFQGGIAEMDREVVLELKLAKEQEPFAVMSTNEAGEKFVAVSFVPEFEEVDEGASDVETVFVLDCSGSMSGQSIEQATAALECCLRAMNAGARFNVCRFGSTHEMLWPEPAAYDAATMSQAVSFIRRGADLGGTEILAPLEEILGKSPANKGVRNIVLLTDGQVSNEPAVIALARRKRSRNRFFTFGIGPACSQFLVKGLARVTGGAAEFIGHDERIEEKVLRAFGRMTSPPVTNVEVEFEGADVEAAPREVPPVFDGDAVRMYARVLGGAPRGIVLRCQTATGPRSWRLQIIESHRPVRDVLAVMWARMMIRSIEDEDARAAASSAAGKEDRRAIEISKKYGVLCSGTSFIAVEHRCLEDRNEGKPELRRVPVMLADGWGGTEMAGRPAAVPCMAPMAAPSAPARKSRRSRGFGGLMDLAKSLLGGGGRDRGIMQHLAAPGGARDAMDELMDLTRDETAMDELDAPPPTVASGPPDRGDALIRLLSLQSADGGFDDADWLNGWFWSDGIDRKALEAAITQWPALGKAAWSRMVRTLLILVVLQQRFADRRDVWKRAAAKARKLVAGELKLAAAEVERQVAVWAK